MEPLAIPSSAAISNRGAGLRSGGHPKDNSKSKEKGDTSNEVRKGTFLKRLYRHFHLPLSFCYFLLSSRRSMVPLWDFRLRCLFQSSGNQAAASVTMCWRRGKNGDG